MCEPTFNCCDLWLLHIGKCKGRGQQPWVLTWRTTILTVEIRHIDWKMESRHVWLLPCSIRNCVEIHVDLNFKNLRPFWSIGGQLRFQNAVNIDIPWILLEYTRGWPFYCRKGWCRQQRFDLGKLFWTDVAGVLVPRMHSSSFKLNAEPVAEI